MSEAEQFQSRQHEKLSTFGQVYAQSVEKSEWVPVDPPPPPPNTPVKNDAEMKKSMGDIVARARRYYSNLLR